MWLVILLFVFVRVCMGVHPILGNCHFIVALLAVFYFSNYCVVCCLLPVFVVCVWTLGSLTYYYLIVFRYATGTDQTDLRTALLCLCRVCGRRADSSAWYQYGRASTTANSNHEASKCNHGYYVKQ